ncbi:MAG: GntR family transcriptional regulator [Verrucomicrobiota bacterium]
MKEQASETRRNQDLREGSLQQQIYDYISSKIVRQEFKEGDFLPSTRELAKHFDTSISPVHRALDQLVNERVVEKIHGCGVRVIADDPTQAIVRGRPAVDLITSLNRPNLHNPPSSKREHLLPAIEEWLFWALSHHTGLRLSVSTIPLQQDTEEILDQRIKEAEIMRSNVVVFAQPENLSQRTIGRIQAYAANGLKIVYLATWADIRECDQIRSDFAQGQCALTRHLLNKGHKKILRIQSNKDALFEKQKSQGFQQALREFGYSEETVKQSTVLGISHDKNPEIRIPFYRDLIEEKMSRGNYTAVMATNDPAVADIRIALRQMGISDDVEITGYDADWNEMDWPDKFTESWLDKYHDVFAENARPASVNTQLPAVAQAMADMVIARAFRKASAPPQIITVSQLLEA